MSYLQQGPYPMGGSRALAHRRRDFLQETPAAPFQETKFSSGRFRGLPFKAHINWSKEGPLEGTLSLIPLLNPYN